MWTGSDVRDHDPNIHKSEPINTDRWSSEAPANSALLSQKPAGGTAEGVNLDGPVENRCLVEACTHSETWNR